MIKTFYTENSVYEIDEEGGRYRRSPRSNKMAVSSHRLVYDEWLPLKSWDVLDDGTGPYLHIMASDSVRGICTSHLTYPEEMS